jgi:hypothetical protein
MSDKSTSHGRLAARLSRFVWLTILSGVFLVAGLTTAPAARADETPRQLLDGIRSAMAQRDLLVAEAKLKQAGSLELPDDLAVEAERLQLMYDYLLDFWHAVDDAGKTLQAGEHLVFGDAHVAVVEYGNGRIVVRALGQNRRYTLKTMPTKLVMKLASRTLNARLSANKVFLGTYHAVDAKGDRGEARRLWEEARRGGEDVSQILPEVGVATTQPTKPSSAAPTTSASTSPAPHVEMPPLAVAGKMILAAEKWTSRRRTATQWVRSPLGDMATNTAEGRLQVAAPKSERGDVQVLFARKLSANFGCRVLLTDLPKGQVFGIFPGNAADGGHVVPLPDGKALVEFARYAGKYRARINQEEVAVESAAGTPTTLEGYVGFSLSPGSGTTVAAFELRGN